MPDCFKEDTDERSFLWDNGEEVYLDIKKVSLLAFYLPLILYLCTL